MTIDEGRRADQLYDNRLAALIRPQLEVENPPDCPLITLHDFMDNSAPRQLTFDL